MSTASYRYESKCESVPAYSSFVTVSRINALDPRHLPLCLKQCVSCMIMDECVCQYKIKRWKTEHRTFAEVQFYDINPAFANKRTEDFESMAFSLLRAFDRVERASEIEEGELYIRSRNGRKEFVRKRKSVTTHTEMCKCSHEHGFDEQIPRRNPLAQREAELVARQQKLQAELAECQERERHVRIGTRERKPYHYVGERKLKFDFELEEREPAQYETQPHHHHEHFHHHRRSSRHHHHHVHCERRPSYVRERPMHVPVRRPSYRDDALLYQRVVVNRRRRSSGGYRIITRNYFHQQPEVVRYENRSPGDYC